MYAQYESNLTLSIQRIGQMNGPFLSRTVLGIVKTMHTGFQLENSLQVSDNSQMEQ